MECNCRRYGNSLFLMQLIVSQPNTPNLCPIFIWNSNHFDLIDELPCTNSMNMEQFDIEPDIYVALANYKDEFGKLSVPKEKKKNRNLIRYVLFGSTLILFLQDKPTHFRTSTNTTQNIKSSCYTSKSEPMQLWT